MQSENSGDVNDFKIDSQIIIKSEITENVDNLEDKNVPAILQTEVKKEPPEHWEASEDIGDKHLNDMFIPKEVKLEDPELMEKCYESDYCLSSAHEEIKYEDKKICPSVESEKAGFFSVFLPVKEEEQESDNETSQVESTSNNERPRTISQRKVNEEASTSDQLIDQELLNLIRQQQKQLVNKLREHQPQQKSTTIIQPNPQKQVVKLLSKLKNSNDSGSKNVLQAVPGIRQNAMLFTVHDGFYYRYTGVNAIKTFYTCYKRNCNARVWSYHEDGSVSKYENYQEHNHEPEPLMGKVWALRETIYNRVEHENLPLQQIFEEECSRVGDEVASHLSFSKMESSLKTKRRGPIKKSRRSPAREDKPSLMKVSEMQEEEKNVFPTNTLQATELTNNKKENTLQAVPGIRQNAMLFTVNDGYYYRYTGVTSAKTFYTCYKLNCKARVWSDLKDGSVSKYENYEKHNHDPEPLMGKVWALRESIYERVEQENLPLKQIFQEECSRVDDEVARHLSFTKMESSLKTKRRKLSLPSSASVDNQSFLEVSLTLEEETSDNEHHEDEGHQIDVTTHPEEVEMDLQNENEHRQDEGPQFDSTTNREEIEMNVQDELPTNTLQDTEVPNNKKDNTLQTVPGIRRNAMLFTVNDGFYYRYTAVTSDKTFYTCYKRNCSAKVWSYLKDGSVSKYENYQEHNHEPEPLMGKVWALRETMYNRAEHENLPLKQIFEEECSRVDDAVASQLSFTKMESSLKAKRRKRPFPES